MTILQSVILGIIQGITEFLPISSSAHLVLIPHLLGWELNEEFIFPFDVLVQIGTLVAVIFYYRADLAEIFKSVVRGIRNKQPFEEEPARIGWLALLASIPAGFTGLLIKDQIKAAFSSPDLTAVFLFGTAGLLILGEFLGKKSKELDSMGWLDALWIGVFQAISVLPGVSRSGSTITGGMTRSFNRKSSGQFAFLMAIPIMLAAGLLGLLDLVRLPNPGSYLPQMVIGFITAASVGYFAIRWLIDYISSHSLLPFAGYCLILAAGSLLLTGFQPVSKNAIPASAPAPAASKAEIFKVSIEPNLEWLLPAMNACQQKDAGLHILFQQKAVGDSTIGKDDVFILYGEVTGLSDNVYQIGTDRLQIVSHPGATLNNSFADLAALIFSGEIKIWEEASQSCPGCFSSAPGSDGINPYIFPSGSILRGVSLDIFPAGFNYSSTAFIAPNAKAMREAVSRDSAAIGFLPGKWVDVSVKVIPLEEAQLNPEIPILAYTGNNFDSDLAGWLACVQNRIG